MENFDEKKVIVYYLYKKKHWIKSLEDDKKRKKEVCEMFIKIGEKNYYVENSEIEPDSESLTIVIPENQWP